MVKDSTSLPCVAIGGLNLSNAQDAVAAGASGMAIVSAVFDRSEDAEVVRTAEALCSYFK